MKRFGFLKLLAAAPIAAQIAPAMRVAAPVIANAQKPWVVVATRTPRMLVVHPDMRKIAEEVLNSEWSPRAWFSQPKQ